MIWYDNDFNRKLEAFLAPRVLRAAKFVAGYIKINLAANVGSVVPFVASTASEWPYLWDGNLQRSVVALPAGPLSAVVYSDAVDEHVHPGHHFSYEEEMGHWWDGWAWDFQTGKIVKVAPAHEVAPRRYLRRGLLECHTAIFDIITGNGVAA